MCLISSRSFGKVVVALDIDLEQIRSSPQLHAAYVNAFDLYAAEPSEAGLHVAYELGRRAIELAVSVPELARIHHAALEVALESRGPGASIVVRRGADFLAECLSAFEMIRRGYTEAHSQVVEERRHAALLRQLSILLADTSLAVDRAGSLTEALQLIAEAARELTTSRCCIATLEASAAGGKRLTVVSGSLAPDDRDATLVAEISELGGRSMGRLRVVAADGEDFSSLHEAVLEQLAQMAGAALERTRLYS